MNYSSNLLLFSTNKSFFNTLLVNKSIIMGAPLWGTCKSILAAVAMDKNVIKKIIPNGIAFTPQNITGAGGHPVIFMFNKQKIRIFFSWLIINYYEMIPLIPWAQFGSFGSGDGQFGSFSNITIDGSGNIYMLDNTNSRIQKFNSTGQFISKNGSNGTGDNQFSLGLFLRGTGNAIAIDTNGNIYVADYSNKRVPRIDSNTLNFY